MGQYNKLNFLNRNKCFQFGFQVYADGSRVVTSIHQLKVTGQGLTADVSPVLFNRSIQGSMTLNLQTDFIGNIQTTVLTQILNTVNQFTGITFLAQVLTNGNVQCHSNPSFIGHQPAGNVLTDDFHILGQQLELLPVYLHGKRTSTFKSRYIFGSHCTNSRGYRLHQFAVLWTQRLEVWFNGFNQNTGTFFQVLQLLHIHLIQNQILHRFQLGLKAGIQNRDHDLLQGLTHLNAYLTTQGQYHRGNLLGIGHTLLQALINQSLHGLRHQSQMHRSGLPLSLQVAVQLLHIKRRNGRSQQRYSLQALMQSLVGRQLILIKGSSPKTLPVQSYVPITQVFGHEVLNGTSRPRRLILVVGRMHILHQGVE